ncbi:MAG: 50S ribosomal protein L25/general stress protein Ctc [Campylobacteraceae bacterium]|nr:50S ribosomal protein L25/general stress protein Ctc [Campylobacteraceae bacterium]
MLEGIIRESIEKKSTKALRRDGYLIANIYGKGLPNINAAFKENEFIKAVRKKETLAFPVKVGDKTLDVVVIEYQKDPINSHLVHVDLKVAQKGLVTKYMIPVRPVGTPVGLKNKGILVQSKKRLCVKCKAEDLPTSFEINVSDLDVGDTVLVRDLEVPANITMMETDRIAVVGVIKAK